jgi:hypothetical protein
VSGERRRREQPGVLGSALAQWADRANAAGKAAARRAGGTAIGAIDAMLRRLDLLRGQVTRDPPDRRRAALISSQ